MSKHEAVEALRDAMTMFRQFEAMTVAQLTAVRTEAASRSDIYANMVDWLIAERSK